MNDGGADDCGGLVVEEKEKKVELKLKSLGIDE